MKLLAVNSRFFSFIEHTQRVTDRKADNWLLHEDEFYVHWVGEGTNLNGAVLTGGEMEESFFMYNMDELWTDSDTSLYASDTEATEDSNE